METENGWQTVLRRGTNAIWVVRETGDLFASNGRTVFFSRDAGGTWQEAPEAQAQGRHYNSIAVNADWRGSRLAVFPIDSPVGWMTLDGGGSWTTFAKPAPPAVRKHDGWTYGAVDWSEERPTRMFGKEHHSGNYWVSRDAGKSWRKLETVSGYCGIGFGSEGSLLLGLPRPKEGKPQPKGAEKPGILRSTELGRSWALAFACDLTPKVCGRWFKEHIYWPTLGGLARSNDGGASWELLEGSPEGLLYGPFFGETDAEMVAVSEKGVFATSDAGSNWRLALARDDLPKAVRDGNFGELMPNFAWDWRRGLVYATSMGAPLFRCELTRHAAEQARSADSLE